jgi:hypothetical protein
LDPMTLGGGELGMRMLGLIKVAVSTFLTVSAIGIISVLLVVPTASPVR